MANQKTLFIKEGPDKRGKYDIIEGHDRGNNLFSIKRFICQITPQQTEKETVAIADMLVQKLNN
ncbi:MAG: hypothetical protein WA775_02880 [Psychroserpens sp.]|uniref:hypothetical protein n=1 Tax=Psychroserpens sp. TaxID=2020870 RepID=UPI003CA6BA41